MSGYSPEVESRDHYAYVTRSLIKLYNEGALTNVVGIDVEPEYGYTARLRYTDGTYRITYGNDLGLNPGAAEDLAKDKGHTKFLLRAIGVECPDGREFLLPWWAETIGSNQQKKGNTSMHIAAEAAEYVESSLGYPVYVKPVAGSKGIGVQRVDTAPELGATLAELNAARSRVAIVEEAISMPDYRIVVLDGELISAYRRDPLAVVGDGTKTIGSLLDSIQHQYDQEGRDTVIDPSSPNIRSHLLRNGMDMKFVPSEGVKIELASISNLSAGGTSEDVAGVIGQRWIETATYIADNFNLRLCGVDLACEDITNDDADYSVIEVNSTPGLDHYAMSGAAQQRVVDELYAKVLNAFPHT